LLFGLRLDYSLLVGVYLIYGDNMKVFFHSIYWKVKLFIMRVFNI
jgi:hypothetical protein